MACWTAQSSTATGETSPEHLRPWPPSSWVLLFSYVAAGMPGFSCQGWENGLLVCGKWVLVVSTSKGTETGAQHQKLWGRVLVCVPDLLFKVWCLLGVSLLMTEHIWDYFEQKFRLGDCQSCLPTSTLFKILCNSSSGDICMLTRCTTQTNLEPEKQIYISTSIGLYNIPEHKYSEKLWHGW